MALTTATVVDGLSQHQPGTLGRLRARRVTITFTAGYDSATGVTLKAADVGLAQIVDIIPEGVCNTGAAVSAVNSGTTGNSVLTLWNGTTLVATSDQSATTVRALVIGN